MWSRSRRATVTFWPSITLVQTGRLTALGVDPRVGPDRRRGVDVDAERGRAMVDVAGVAQPAHPPEERVLVREVAHQHAVLPEGSG